MTDVSEKIEAAERLEMNLMKKGKTHAEAEREEKKFLKRPERTLNRGGARK